MAKIQGDSGQSLADTYDVVGSSAPIETLVSHDVNLVHEMGDTIFSERFSGVVRRAVSGALLQTVAFDVIVDNIAEFPARIHSIAVLTDVAARVLKAQVSILDERAERELPIWAWESAAGVELPIRIIDNGAAVANMFLLMPSLNLQIPSILSGSESPRPVNAIAFRGLTETFGAGNVNLTLLFHLSFTGQGGVSSRGLPIPSW